MSGSMNQTLIPTTVSELRAQWNSLHELDRAEAVKKIHETGVSIRSIARQVGFCSESYLRMILDAAKADSSDCALARRGEINMRELARRAVALHTDPKLRARQCKKWSTAVCRWLQQTGCFWTQQSSILDEARREIMFRAQGAYCRLETQKGDRLPQIIERNRPYDLEENYFQVAYYARWLARWMLAAIPADLLDAVLVEAMRMTTENGS
jgi:AraC-like DNA-binding protein